MSRMPKDNNSIKGIIFDLDGTLYHMKWFMRPLLTFKVFPHCLRLPRFFHERGKFAGMEMNSRENLLNRICEAVSKIENSGVDEIHEWISNNFYPAFISIMPYLRNSRPLLEPTLKRLRSVGIRTGVLSDFDKVRERLIGLDIDPLLFDTISSSESFGALKPSARPFLNIAEQWGITPENILVIGDRDDTDGEAAGTAGMQFIKITDSKIQNNNEFSWHEMRNHLENIKPRD